MISPVERPHVLPDFFTHKPNPKLYETLKLYIKPRAIYQHYSKKKRLKNK